MVTVCAKQSSIQPARTLGFPNGFSGRRADLSSSSGSYRVLRGGRQQPSRSVDRKSAGRNASEAIEPRQLLGVCVPSQYLNGEGNTFCLVKAGGHSGVRVLGMYSSRLDGELGRSYFASQRGQGLHKKGNFKCNLKRSQEVRWLHSSEEVV